MATSNVVNTTLLKFQGGNSGGTVVSRQNDVTFTVNHEPRDITTKDSAGWRELLEGLRSYEISISGLLAYDDTLSVYTSSTGIDAILRARTVQTWILGTAVSGDVKLCGTGYWTSLEVGSPDKESNCTYSATLQGTGQYYVGTF